MVDDRVLDSVLAPHRARFAPGPIPSRPQPFRTARPHEHPAALGPRVELHLFYNTIVFIPMVIAMYHHMFPPQVGAGRPKCTCAWHSRIRARGLTSTLAGSPRSPSLAAPLACERASHPATMSTASWSARTGLARQGPRNAGASSYCSTARGSPVRGARLQFEAHMAHPGMAPVIAAAPNKTAGFTKRPSRVTMPGSWTVVASGTLPDGRRLTRSFNVRDVR